MGLKANAGKGKQADKPDKAKAKATKPKGSYSDDDINYDDIAGDYQRQKGGDFFTLSQPRTKLRIIPFFSQKENRKKAFEVERKHFKVLPEIKVCDCIGEVNGCPVCEVARKVTDETTRKRLRSSEKFLMVAVLRDEGDRCVVWRAPFGAWTNIMAVVQDRDNFPDALSLKNGLDFVVIKEGSGTGARYSAQVAPKRTSVSVPDSIPDLTDLLVRRKPNDLEDIAKKMARAYDV